MTYYYTHKQTYNRKILHTQKDIHGNITYTDIWDNIEHTHRNTGYIQIYNATYIQYDNSKDRH